MSRTNPRRCTIVAIIRWASTFAIDRVRTMPNSSTVFTRESRMLRASLPSSGRLSVCLSVWLSVCPSVTLVSCIKTVQARITKSSLWTAPSSLWTAPRSLVYRDKISCHWVQGFPSNEGVEEGYPPKKDVILPLLARIMWKRLQIGIYMLLIITSTGDRLFGFINTDDLERPWTPQKEVFSEFFAIFGCSAHFNTELRRNGWR